MEQEDLRNEFPVDLSRDEYVDFNLLLQKAGGALRLRRGMMIAFLILAVFSLLLLVVDWIHIGQLDLPMLLCVLLTGAVAVSLQVIPGLLVRQNAGKTYDQNVLSGHDFYGMVRVYPDRIEKITGDVTACIRFAENASYIETETMMVLLTNTSRAIVLPARCMTREDADSVRQAVLPGIPVIRQRLFGKMIPKATSRMAPPQIHQEESISLMSLRIVYESDEFLKWMQDSISRNYGRVLPFFSVISLVLALAFGFMSGFLSALLAFVGMMILMTLLNWVLPRSRSKRMVEIGTAANRTLQLDLTEKGLIGKSTTPGEELRLPWSSIRHAVDREDCVEFSNKRVFIRVPKRCIPDIEELRRIVDSHLPRSQSSR